MLDEDALEAMLARGRAAKNDDAEMVTTDQNDEFEVYERKPEPERPEPEPEPTPAPQAVPQDDFEVYGEDPEAPEPAEPDMAFQAFEAPMEPPAPEPQPAAEPVQRRRAEVWPPIRSHAPRPEPTPEPAPAPEPVPTLDPVPEPAAPENPTVHNHADLPRHAGGARVAIVQCMFNGELTDMMSELASRQIGKHNGEVVAHVKCPGVYDVPLPTKQLLARDDVDAVVVIGVVVQGETKHDELITNATAKTLQELSLEFNKPVGLGITGPGMTWKQAEQRVVNGAHAVDAVMQLIA